jgi:hypothetical protein
METLKFALTITYHPPFVLVGDSVRVQELMNGFATRDREVVGSGSREHKLRRQLDEPEEQNRIPQIICRPCEDSFVLHDKAATLTRLSGFLEDSPLTCIEASRRGTLVGGGRIGGILVTMPLTMEKVPFDPGDIQTTEDILHSLSRNSLERGSTCRSYSGHPFPDSHFKGLGGRFRE